MRDNVGSLGRLKGNHIRHHLKRGILKAGCSFCMEMGAPAVEPEAPEPAAAILTTTEPPETPGFDAESDPPLVVTDEGTLEVSPDAIAAAKRQHWRDQAWQIASTNLEARAASRLLGCTEEFFHGEVEALFQLDWPGVCELSMLQALTDLQSSCIRQARKGDFRAVGILQKENLLPLFDFAKNRKSRDDLRNLTDEELNTRTIRALEARGYTVTGTPKKDGEGNIIYKTPLQITSQETIEIHELPREQVKDQVYGSVFIKEGSPALQKDVSDSSPVIQEGAGVTEDTESHMKGPGSPTPLPMPPEEFLRLRAMETRSQGPVICFPEPVILHSDWALDSDSSERRHSRRQRLPGGVR